MFTINYKKQPPKTLAVFYKKAVLEGAVTDKRYFARTKFFRDCTLSI